jgi:hypothetical protein
MSFYTGTPVNDKYKLIRAGREAQIRGCRVGEHPSFGGVNSRYHISTSKHSIGRAWDANRTFYTTGPAAEQEKRFNDRFAMEMMARGFGVISNRARYINGRWVYDHIFHIHIETIGWTSENYSGRVRLHYPRWRSNLSVDGKIGPLTNRALATSLGVTTGSQTWRGVSTNVARCLQAYLNTELNAGLVVDGKFGQKSSQAMSRYFGMNVSSHGYMTQGHTRELQSRLNKHGHFARA